LSVADRFIQATLLGEAVDFGPACVFVADEERKYVAVNQAACDVLGYTRDELLKLRVDDVAASNGKWEEMQINGTVSGTTEIRRKDGTTVPFRYTAGRTRVAGMPVFVSVGTVEAG
jgi:PAS domain S-box-containing protein